ncbi:hypothetical protein Q4566_08880 [Tamlana sp. 2_MG-2023]|uniref:hypothetical protein n=1 Tax=unclassified Tamlana TaxID=2614803 RepID=UPI0026E1F8EC|nr:MULTISPECIES: hypothetical protein [unclassified Tamlana]MDO6760309.1 hypothetical protein [Tamlana sp. 2_MG-2023]MDO6789993.1 hypothetical protein [Tamlana sp. 1_MG-2023]
MKKQTIGLVISLVGLAIMGFSIGSRLISGENNLGLTFGGLFIVFIGLFIVILNNKRKVDKG